ncbi:MAG: hypothetical protein QNJ73_04940 [Gammaproteobacteria bacterium]|nr:hypothetical protein [Gammaproteobacteria bacterium]
MGDHESLRQAVRWLGERPPITAEKIAEAACRFDLSPLDEEFLLREFAEEIFKDNDLQGQ